VVAALAAAGVVGPCNLDEPDDGASVDITDEQRSAHRQRPPAQGSRSSSGFHKNPDDEAAARANPTLKGPTTARELTEGRRSTTAPTPPRR
jgi:hypothetical protein